MASTTLRTTCGTLRRRITSTTTCSAALVNTELQENPDGSWFKHIFFQLDDGGCIAFFKVQASVSPTDSHGRLDRISDYPCGSITSRSGSTPTRPKALSGRMKEGGVAKTMDVITGGVTRAITPTPTAS